MKDKLGRIADQRRYLKIKIKHLAEEARIIRFEERKTKGPERWQLQHHRKTTVRNAARQALIAYQVIRGKDVSVYCPSGEVEPYDKSEVDRMVKKYGKAPFLLAA